MDYNQESLIAHEKYQGKIGITTRMPVTNKDELSIAYTPGVAEPCRKIAENKEDVYKYTCKGRMVAVITDGSAVLGLGNIGPEASLPVMEGKCVLFKEFGGVDAIPLALDTQDTEEIIKTITYLAPGLGGINLEDISAPRCFEIEKRLKETLNIPVFHDDQHGTAIVVLAGLINALKITGKKAEELKIIMAGAGAAGIAIAKLLLTYGVKKIILTDRKGAIYKGRAEGMNPIKEEMADITNLEKEEGSLADVMKGADVFIGVSSAGLVTQEMIETMNKDAIIFAMANPTPEIMPDVAKKAGAKIIATGRSDFPNQINNVLAFPGIFKGVLEIGAKAITEEMKMAAAKGLAEMVEEPTADKIIPGPFEKGVAEKVSEAVKRVAQ